MDPKRAAPKTYTKAFIQTIVADFHQSGQGLSDFATAHDLSPSTLHRWLRARQKLTSPTPPTWLPVHLKDSPPPARASQTKDVTLRLPGGLLLRFAKDTDLTYLASLLRMLQKEVLC